MNINQIIKGIIVGIAKVIPGFSGAVLMISFNLYDKAIDAITGFFNNPKKNFLFLLNIGLGIIFGIILFSKIIYYFITNYYLYTLSLFLGLIIGGIPVISNNVPREKKYLFYLIVSFGIIFSFSFLGSGGDYELKNNYIDYIVFFVAGFFEATGTILPGISSTALLMVIGVYNHYLVVLSGILNFSYIFDTLRFILPFSFGMFFGIACISILVNYLFKNYKNMTFSLILGLSIASIFILAKDLLSYIKDFKQFIVCVSIVLCGYFITNKLDD